MEKVNIHLITGREKATIIRELTDNELQDLGGKIANQVVLMGEREDSWKEELKARNDEKKADTTQLKTLAKQRKTGHFEGEMEVGLILDQDGKRMLQVDMETGQILATRIATTAERQQSIDFEGTENVRKLG